MLPFGDAERIQEGPDSAPRSVLFLLLPEDFVTAFGVFELDVFHAELRPLLEVTDEIPSCPEVKAAYAAEFVMPARESDLFWEHVCVSLGVARRFELEGSFAEVVVGAHFKSPCWVL